MRPCVESNKMNTIRTIFSRPWDIRSPILTRYLETQYVDQFINKGKLRLSSFKAFRSNPDEQKGDISEGRVNMQIGTPNGNHVIVAMNGQKAYVLCAGTVEDKNMKASFKTEDGFRILNTLGFANAISSHIPGFVAGMEGLCCYRKDLLIKKDDNKPISNPDTYSNPEKWAEEHDRYVAEQARETFFVKHIDYAHQGEYRFIWFASGNEEDHIDITCPEGKRFCQRLPK